MEKLQAAEAGQAQVAREGEILPNSRRHCPARAKHRVLPIVSKYYSMIRV